MTNQSTTPNTALADGEEMMSMAELLDSGGAPEPRTLRRGEVVEGIVMGTERDGVLVDLVDIGSKSEGLIPVQEMHSLGADPASKLNVGERVLVYVVQSETNEGQVLLSIDRARGEQGWRVLQTRFEEGEIFEAEVTGYNKGGLLANVEGVNAFIPMSQVVGAKPGTEGTSSLAEQVGRTLRLKVIEINRRRNRAILSERAALQEWRSEQKERLLDELREGEIRTGRITSIRNFGVFVDLGGADGLAHLSELSWDRNASPEERFKVGDEVKVFVMKVDQENKKIALSIRRAAPEQWQDLIASYAVGDVVPGVVTKLVAFGAFTRLPGPVEGLVHVSELVDRRITHPQEVVDEGDVVPLKIVRIEHDRHRLGLSLRDARAEAEQRGWQFDDQGRVVALAPDAIEAFPSEAAAIEGRLESRMAERQPAQTGGRSGGGGGGGGRRDEGDTSDSRRERDDAPPMTAMAAAMQQAQAQLDAENRSAATEAPDASAEAPDAAPGGDEVNQPVTEAPVAAGDDVSSAVTEAPVPTSDVPVAVDEPVVEPAGGEAPPLGDDAAEAPEVPEVVAAAGEAPEPVTDAPPTAE